MPPKRSHDRWLESNGRKKWSRTTYSDVKHNPLILPPGTVVFRVLCPASKSGGLIGKGGGVVNKIRKETGAKIKIEEPIPGCDERVVVITGFDNVRNKESDEAVYSDDVKEYNEIEDDNVNSGERENHEEDDENAKEKKISQSSQSVDHLPSAQKALLLIFDKIAEIVSVSEDFFGDDDDDEENKNSSNVTVRMLVESTQVGCLLGKGGSIIKQMAEESGAQIRILPNDKLPLCISEFNELVQVVNSFEFECFFINLTTACLNI